MVILWRKRKVKFKTGRLKIQPKHGATHFAIRNEGSRPAAITFTVNFKDRPLNFLLPVNHKSIWQMLKVDKKANAVLKKAQIKNDEEHAFNVGWRIVKDWIEAQLALVEVEMVKIEVVFLPYLIVNSDGDTLSKKLYDGNGLKLLNL
jgi:hypothetical protein